MSDGPLPKQFLPVKTNVELKAKLSRSLVYYNPPKKYGCSYSWCFELAELPRIYTKEGLSPGEYKLRLGEGAHHKFIGLNLKVGAELLLLLEEDGTAKNWNIEVLKEGTGEAVRVLGDPADKAAPAAAPEQNGNGNGNGGGYLSYRPRIDWGEADMPGVLYECLFHAEEVMAHERFPALMERVYAAWEAVPEDIRPPIESWYDRWFALGINQAIETYRNGRFAPERSAFRINRPLPQADESEQGEEHA